MSTKPKKRKQKSSSADSVNDGEPDPKRQDTGVSHDDVLEDSATSDSPGDGTGTGLPTGSVPTSGVTDVRDDEFQDAESRDNDVDGQNIDGGGDAEEPTGNSNSDDVDEPTTDAAGPEAATELHTSRSAPTSHATGTSSQTKQTTLAVANDTGRKWGYKGKVDGRITAIRTMKDEASSTYFVSNLPQDLDWVSVVSPSGVTHLAVGIKGSKLPVKIWFVGILANSLFFEINGDPRAQVSTNLKMLDGTDSAIANDLVKRFSVGNEAPAKYDDIRFAAWTNVRRRGQARAVPETFSELYDATKGLQLPRSKMNYLIPENLHDGDLVMVESTVQRYYNHKDGKKTDKRKWLATFNLNWIALLDDSPPPASVSGAVEQKEVSVSF